MKRRFLVQVAIFALSLCAALAGCSSGGSGTSNTTPQPNVTAVTVSPTSVSVYAGTTQQFTANVVGSAGVSTAVTWSVMGDGTISDSGLFTAGSNSGSATVMATSQVGSVMGSAAVTISIQPVAFGNWYGTLVSSDGAQTMPMDFSLTRTGNNLTSTNGYTVLVMSTDPNMPNPPCANFSLQSTPSIGSVLQPTPNFASYLGGTINGQTVSLSYIPQQEPNQNPATVTITLTGTLSQDGSTITGTFGSSAYTCFANVTSGTFSFAQYSLQTVNYNGSFGDAPFSAFVDLSGFSTITAGPITSTNCAASTYPMLAEQEGRYFHLWEENFAAQSTPLVVWGIANDPGGQTLNTFVVANLNNYGGIQNSCFEPTTALQTTLTAQ